MDDNFEMFEISKLTFKAKQFIFLVLSFIHKQDLHFIDLFLLIFMDFYNHLTCLLNQSFLASFVNFIYQIYKVLLRTMLRN